MKVIKKMAEKAKDLGREGVTLAFLGDSVTQGCFEIYSKGNEAILTVFDKRYSYEMMVLEIFNMLYPTVTINIINAGIAGDRAPNGLKRLERDVIRHEPDLTVVCYGLNDSKDPGDSVGKYVTALEEIFQKLMDAGSEIIYMTPNMMNTHISPCVTDPLQISVAERCAEVQNTGVLAAHLEAGKALCKKCGIPVCDCYAIWKMLSENGVDTTELLSNKINHPTREMNKLFAIELVRTMFYAE